MSEYQRDDFESFLTLAAMTGAEQVADVLPENKSFYFGRVDAFQTALAVYRMFKKNRTGAQ